MYMYVLNSLSFVLSQLSLSVPCASSSKGKEKACSGVLCDGGNSYVLFMNNLISLPLQFSFTLVWGLF